SSARWTISSSPRRASGSSCAAWTQPRGAGGRAAISSAMRSSSYALITSPVHQTARRPGSFPRAPRATGPNSGKSGFQSSLGPAAVLGAQGVGRLEDAREHGLEVVLGAVLAQAESLHGERVHVAREAHGQRRPRLFVPAATAGDEIGGGGHLRHD